MHKIHVSKSDHNKFWKLIIQHKNNWEVHIFYFSAVLSQSNPLKTPAAMRETITQNTQGHAWFTFTQKDSKLHIYALKNHK